MKKFLIKLVVVLVVLAVIGCAVFIAYQKRNAIISRFMPNDLIPDISEVFTPAEPEINLEYISKTIENISSLQTAKITYGCMVDFEEGSVKFINKKAFSMFYEATAYAGIDVSKITVTEENGKYIVQLPESRIEEKPNIDSSSFVFYDKEAGLINKFSPEDVGKALEYAQSDVYYQATTDQLLDLADSNAVSVIKNLLLCFLPEEQFEVRPGARTQDLKIKPPISSDEAIKKYDGSGKNYKDLEKLFKDAGFTNVKTEATADLKFGVLAKEGAVSGVSIDGRAAFRKSNIFSADAEIIITYRVKKAK